MQREREKGTEVQNRFRIVKESMSIDMRDRFDDNELITMTEYIF